MGTYPEDVDDVRAGIPWWIVLLTGIATLILGVLLVTSPGMTILTLVEFLGFYWLVIGIFSFVEIFLTGKNIGRKLLQGFLGILAGLTVLRHPLTSAIFIPAIIAIVVAIEGIIIGIVTLVRAFRERSLGMGFLGVLSVLIGVAILLSPLYGAATLSIIVGVLAIIGGIGAIIVSFRVRGEERRPAPSQPVYPQQMPRQMPEQMPVTGSDETSGSKEE